MKIKKFKNLWTMGLILFGAILIALYVAKIFFPEFIVGIAEIESVVKFGEYVDAHQWSYYLFNGLVSFVGGYIYCCACCRKKRLTLAQTCIVVLEVIGLFIVQKYLFNLYEAINLMCMVLMPTIMCAIDKRLDIKYLYSTTTCFMIHCIAQLLSLRIRDISTLISYPNVATLTILLIDAFIWLVLLYNYFNYKERR